MILAQKISREWMLDNLIGGSKPLTMLKWGVLGGQQVVFSQIGTDLGGGVLGTS